MDNSKLQELKQAANALDPVVKEICNEYGLYGNADFYTPSPIAESDRNRFYIIAGQDPSIDDEPLAGHIRPDEILCRNGRNQKLFYPDLWVFDISSEKGGRLHAIQELVDYCQKAEFISSLYGKYGLKSPNKIRISEINQLAEFCIALENPLLNDKAKAKCQRQLDRFFKRERSESKFKRSWLDYFRSEKFPDYKGPLARLIGYFKRNSNNSTLDMLTNVNSDLRKLGMQEHEYKVFVSYMKDVYPEVTFSCGEKTVVDHGYRQSRPGDDINVRLVTGEELAVIQKERFANEGYEALAGLKPCYWEFRDVYYKAADAPLIAAAYNRITLSYAKCDELASILEQGDICLQKIPVNDFMNFVSLAKANNLHFYIDTRGEYDVPALDTVNVIYNQYQEDKMQRIMGRMVNDKVEFSHMLPLEFKPSLNSVIKSIETKPQKSKKDYLMKDKER